MTEIELASDRRPEERFRIYRLRDGELKCIATTPDPEGIGLALYTLRSEGEITNDDRTGVLDCFHEPEDLAENAALAFPQMTPTGTWISNPFARG